jgi:hypothetical protein
MHTNLSLAFVGALCIALANVSAAQADSIAMTAELSGANSVPPNDVGGSGVVEASFDTETRVLSWSVVYEGLSGALIAAHIHGPAKAGSNAGIVVGLDPISLSPIVGSATLTEAQANELLRGLYYVNLHTELHPGGELRAQLVP